MDSTLKRAPSGTLRLEFNQSVVPTATVKRTTPTSLTHLRQHHRSRRLESARHASHPQGEGTTPSVTSEDNSSALNRHQTEPNRTNAETLAHRGLSFSTSLDF